LIVLMKHALVVVGVLAAAGVADERVFVVCGAGRGFLFQPY